ncbi:hypothetical protein [Niabella drilacis]|uniref:MlpB protein n=1 Tax=Niabella drilacis (strain DSM 25811 / CCM 8410 / CCUG 62505 / LMG 26954 / E90) TaxID=1285928 RepID=A0A1G6L7L9_NIADE|nr:hypothetical protein [Niabella drilacis]SDC39234.1 hypothetical protein SAMN04487894_102248 [Niabella drilacis]
MNQVIRTGFVICSAVFLAACSSPAQKQETTAAPTPAAVTAALQPGTAHYKKGDPVPSNLVCMVNDAYMGKAQIAVPFNGNTYYGCCEMCKNRIPQDAAVRTAKDPATGKLVDKASAYIVITGNNGEVSYFENAESYKKLAQDQ